MIEDRNFSLDLGTPWERLPGDATQRYNFRDLPRGIVATLSAMPLELKPESIETMASKLVEFRLQAEADASATFDRRITVYEPIVVPRPWGSAIAYYGHDDAKAEAGDAATMDTGTRGAAFGSGQRQFSYSGLVTRRCVINLYMSSGKLSERELMEAMDEVGSRIVFDRTPLESEIAIEGNTEPEGDAPE